MQARFRDFTLRFPEAHDKNLFGFPHGKGGTDPGDEDHNQEAKNYERTAFHLAAPVFS